MEVIIFLVGHINNIKSGAFIKKKPKQTINKKSVTNDII